MTKGSFLRYPATPTKLGFAVLRVRLSLRETQAQFANRFRVSSTTVWKWEKGKVKHMQRIYRELLAQTEGQLKASGRLLPEQLVEILFKEELERFDAASAAV